MSSRIAVALTAHRRPLYYDAVLTSWEATKVIRQFPMILQVEPVMPEVINMSRQFAAYHGNCRVNTNREVLGPLGNPYAALDAAFETYPVEFVVLGEDDSTVSPDVMFYFQFCMERFKRDQEVLAVCAFQHRRNGGPYDVQKRHYFASVIWGTWRDRWETQIKDGWGFNYTTDAWDLRLLRMAEGDRTCVFPCLSRAQHIGKYDGAHMYPAQFEALQADEVAQAMPAKPFKLQVPQGVS